MLKKISSRNSIIIILIIIFILTLILNLLTPIIADDFGYSLNLDKKHLSGIKDIINFQIVHYKYWGGRSIAHTLVQLFLFFPKWVFNIFNSLCFTSLIYLIYKIIKNNKKDKPLFLLLIFLIIYFFVPAFGQNILWLTGSCNYLWTTTIIIFMLNISLYNNKSNMFLNIFLFFLGLISGWTNENTAFGLIIILLSIIISKRHKTKKTYFWQVTNLVGTIIGFTIMILAPGNYVRKDSYLENISFLEKIITRFISCTKGIFTYLLPLVVLLIILLIIYKLKKLKLTKTSIIFLIGTIFTIYPMILSPTFPKRAWFSSFIFLIISTLSLVYNLDIAKQKIKKIKVITFLIIIFFLIDYSYLVIDINKLNNTWKYRINYINNHKNSKEIIFTKYETKNRKNPQYEQLDIVKNPAEWPNNEMEKYFDIKSISIK